ncbi:hypothetical protein [Mesorhizobium sp. M1252]|uniref:hypothetical protein n=1 Tax=Mesorhizobium sp. M1252 TaxID=2957073 RepID=UPI003337563E
MVSNTEPDTGNYPVDILARTIPSGLLGEDLRVTVALRPIKTDKEGSARLDTWPSDIEQSLVRRPPRLELRFPPPVPDAHPSAPATCEPGEQVALATWPGRSDPASARELWQELMVSPGIGWEKLHTDLKSLEDTEKPGEVPSAICVSGRQGEMVLLTKMLRAIETAQLALAGAPHKRSHELALVAWEAAKKFLQASHKVDLAAIYPTDQPQDDGKSADPKLNITQTKLKRDYALKVLERMKAACAESRKVGTLKVEAAATAAAEALLKSTLNKLIDGLTCVLVGKEVVADDKIKALYQRLFELRQFFLFAAALDSGTLDALEKNEKDARDNPNDPPPDLDLSKAKGRAATDEGNLDLQTASAMKRIAALEESPDLGRLFRFFVDFKLPAGELLKRLKGRQVGADGGIFAFVRIAGCDLSTCQRADEFSRWTLTKIRLDKDRTKVLSFLPASRDELILEQSKYGMDQARSVLHQQDGIYLLGGSPVGGDPTPDAGMAALVFPAYELVSADLRAAAREVDSRADRLLSAAALSGDAPPSSIVQRAKSGLRSGGLSVVGFSAAPRLSQLIGTSDAALQLTCGLTFLDAEDLSMGRLPMLAVRAKSGEQGPILHQWHIQTRKRVTYLPRRDQRGGKIDVDQLIAKLYPGHRDGPDSADSPRRLAQASVDRTSPRIFDLTSEGERVLVAAVDAAELTFLGDPMGVETGLAENVQTLDETSNDFLLDRDISLLELGSPEQANAGVLPLRFGMPITAGFSAVYLGGGTLTPAEAAERFAAIAEATVPRRVGDTPPEGRRYLRSEPVASPQVLLPKAEADAVVASYRKPGGPDFGPQTTGQVLLRSRLDESGKVAARLGSDVITRIVLPPLVSLETAEKHGAFDDVRPRCFPGSAGTFPVARVTNVPLFPGAYNRPGQALRPRDGLRDVHCDAGFGGYPLLRQVIGSASDRTATIDAAFDDGQEWLAKARTWARVAEADPTLENPVPASPSGDAVFASIGDKTVDQGRMIPFYPDPMAATLVIRFRTGAEPMSRESVQCLSVPFVDPKIWPDVVPVALEITRREDANRPVIEYKDNVRVSVSGRQCRRVVVNIRPGLSGTLDLWSVPSPIQLEQWSELVDTTASIDCLPGLANAPLLDRLCGCGIMGMDAPHPSRLLAVAERLHKELSTHPLPELAETRSIIIAHATTRPTRPLDVARTADGPMLAMRRAVSGAAADLGPSILLDLPAALPPAWSAQAQEENANEVDLGGFLGVDLASTSGIEITAQAIAPFGTDFDDVTRSRSRDAVNRGIVNPIFDRTTGLQRKAKDLDVYGFSISPHGRVELPTSKQLWARFSNLPPSIEGLQPNKASWVSLHALFGGEPRDIVTDIHPLFGDTRARQVRLKFTAISRHANAFVRRSRILSGEHVAGIPLPSADTMLAPQQGPNEFTQSIWLPASAAPAVPVAAAQAHPVIDEETTIAGSPDLPKIIRKRVTKVRLWLARPWFSSGEGEKLGIVLWPRLSRVRIRSFKRGLLGTQSLYERPSLDASPPSEGLADYMSLYRFEDRFLTGAADYITRWGSDPTEAFPKRGWRDWVVPNDVFCDFEFDSKAGTATHRRSDAAFVAKVAMPIPEVDKQEGKQTETKTQRRKRYLNVDLLTYEPRFDVDREQWYIDLALDPGEMVMPFLRLGVVRYQEHAPADLQVSFPGDPFQLQIQTRRQTSLELVPDPGDQARVRLTVTVQGPASPDSASDVPDGADARVETRMRFDLQGLVHGTNLRRLASGLEVRASGLGDTWRGTFTLPRQALLDPNLHLTVHVAERAYRPPTSYPEAYFQPGSTESKFMSHKELYACSIDVPKLGPGTK